jgi:hypothetical protein
MQIAAELERPLEFGTNRRYAPRRTLTLGSVLNDSGTSVIIHDLSVTGLSLETSDSLGVGERLLVDLPLRGATGATVVWRDGSLFGCEFEETVSPDAISAALLRAAPAARDEIEEADSAVGQENRQPAWSVARKMWLITALSLASWALVLAALAWLL